MKTIWVGLARVGLRVGPAAGARCGALSAGLGPRGRARDGPARPRRLQHRHHPLEYQIPFRTPPPFAAARNTSVLETLMSIRWPRPSVCPIAGRVRGGITVLPPARPSSKALTCRTTARTTTGARSAAVRGHSARPPPTEIPLNAGLDGTRWSLAARPGWLRIRRS